MPRIKSTLLQIAKTIGQIQTALILALFYYIILGPFAIAYRLFKHPKKNQDNPNSYWIKKTSEPPTQESLMKQY